MTTNHTEAAGLSAAEVASAGHLLAARGLTIAFGESATAGSLAYAFSKAAESGKILKGGIVCYDPAVKEALLKVPAELIEKYTAESAAVTRQVAYGVSKLIPADVIVAVTGLVFPGGSESEEKPVGTIFFSILFEGRCRDYRIHCSGGPGEVVEAAITEIGRRLVAVLAV